ncbi:sensor histidine kinase [Amycolatopsis nalaikhensis]|uniref:histidine kinase n=1 Tax=Amycolatopsis nalaikhensis TaxID=715472 RepID=A0ABY8Y2W2_9PSEU|nr:hypothetical protein [Amycolatopsis sp. 2-2]WIV62349.1 hypothetical protein QP939_11040 [Amycolatopsis sp. 2-2]
MTHFALSGPLTWIGPSAPSPLRERQRTNNTEAVCIGEAIPVDLADVAAKAVQETQAEAAEQGVMVEVDCVPVLVDGDPTLPGRLAVNLLHNAIRHNEPGGHVQVRVAHDPGHPTPTVSNTGPRFPTS